MREEIVLQVLETQDIVDIVYTVFWIIVCLCICFINIPSSVGKGVERHCSWFSALKGLLSVVLGGIM